MRRYDDYFDETEEEILAGQRAGCHLLTTWMLVMLCGLLLVLLSGCGGVRYVPVETVRTDSIYMVRMARDSIHVHDSIYLEVTSKADTIYKTKYVQKVVYRDALRVDTLCIERVDSVMVPFPVERKLSRWEQLKLDVGGMAMGAIAVLVVAVIVVWLVRAKK